MEGTFIWLATFFNKYYQPFLEKRCRLKVRASWSKNGLSIYLKKGRVVVLYALRGDEKGISIHRNDRALPLYHYLDPPIVYSHDDALRAFFFLTGKVLREAICMSISSILNHHKIFATVIAPDEPIQVLTEINEGNTLSITPLLKGDKIRFNFSQVKGKFANEIIPIGSIEIPPSKFRPQEIAKMARQLLGLFNL
jgi:hypothetical protein